MTFEEWWEGYVKPASIYTIQQTAKDAWEAGRAEGLFEGYEVGNDDNGLCPKCLAENK